jgi:hypothetical protein
VTYDGKTQTIYCEGSQFNISLTLGGKTAQVVRQVRNNTVQLEQPATIIDGVMLVPLRSICDALNVQVIPLTIDGYEGKVNEVTLCKGTNIHIIFIHEIPPSDVNAIRVAPSSSKISGLQDYDNNKTIIYVYNKYKNYGKASAYMYGYSDDANGKPIWAWADGWIFLRKNATGKWEILFDGSDPGQTFYQDLRAIGVPKDVLAHYDIKKY